MMRFWLTFDENNKVQEVKIGGDPAEGSLEITKGDYDAIVNSAENECWVRNGELLQKIIAPIDAQPSCPPQVKMRQARKALLQMGLLAQVQQFMQTASEEVKIDWEFSENVQRGYPLIDQVKGYLGLTDQQVDQLFILADTIK